MTAIIIISSIGGLKGSPVLGTYAISTLPISIGTQYCGRAGRINIRANAIAPGLIKTYFAQALWDEQAPPAFLKQSTATTPMKRIGMPDEIAGAAVFGQPAGSFMTGQQMVIDGGPDDCMVERPNDCKIRPKEHILNSLEIF